MLLIPKCIGIFLFFVLNYWNYAVYGEDDYNGQLTLQVQHSLDSGPPFEFTPRGAITVRSLKAASILPPPDVELSENEQLKLTKLVENNGLYRIRIPFKINGTVQHLATFLKACSLYESRLQDILTLHTDSIGDLIGVSASTTSPQCTGIEVPLSDLQYFNTVVEVQQMDAGPVPEVAAFIQKLEKEKADKAKNENADNRSFFAKYWMYILPVVIIVFISQLGNPEGQGAGR